MMLLELLLSHPENMKIPPAKLWWRQDEEKIIHKIIFCEIYSKQALWIHDGEFRERAAYCDVGKLCRTREIKAPANDVICSHFKRKFKSTESSGLRHVWVLICFLCLRIVFSSANARGKGQTGNFPQQTQKNRLNFQKRWIENALKGKRANLLPHANRKAEEVLKFEYKLL